ncbi:MAG: helicase HerA domain-containing protein [Candidatus Aenigmatarchaeota archaeon]
MDNSIKLNISKNFSLDAQELVTGRTCVIAQSGAGKSYLIAVLCEHMLKNNIGFCLIDTEGEYFSLKEKFDILWAGGEGADLDIEGVNYSELAEKVVKENIPLILDVSDVMDERNAVEEFSKALYAAETKLRQPFLLIVEEADKFVPQGKDSIKKIEEISRRGRKRGLGILVATQRPALVNKNVLSQCGNQFIGKLTTENDLQAVNLFFATRKELEDLPKLKAGEFFVMGSISKEKIKMKSFPRETHHKGLTPRLVPKQKGRIAQISSLLGKEKEKREPAKTLPSIRIMVDKQKIHRIVEMKRKRKYKVFGEKEHVTGIELTQHPLFYVEVKREEGLLKKGFRTYSFIIDGIGGRMADVRNGLVLSNGMSQLIGLGESEARAMLEIARSKGTTVAELKMKLRLRESSIRKILKALQARNLITYAGKEGRARKYISMTKLKVPNVTHALPYPAKDIQAPGRALKPRVTKQALREVLKALNPTTDITRFDVFYFPVYSVHFSDRAIKIDGVTGIEIY